MAADGSAEYGRLEVFYSGGWGTVCDNDFVTRDRFRSSPGFNGASADVACSQLGYRNGFQIQKLASSSHVCWYWNESIDETSPCMY